MRDFSIAALMSEEFQMIGMLAHVTAHICSLKRNQVARVTTGALIVNHTSTNSNDNLESTI